MRSVESPLQLWLPSCFQHAWAVPVQRAAQWTHAWLQSSPMGPSDTLLSSVVLFCLSPPSAWHVSLLQHVCLQLLLPVQLFYTSAAREWYVFRHFNASLMTSCLWKQLFLQQYCTRPAEEDRINLLSFLLKGLINYSWMCHTFLSCRNEKCWFSSSYSETSNINSNK